MKNECVNLCDMGKNIRSVFLIFYSICWPLVKKVGANSHANKMPTQIDSKHNHFGLFSEAAVNFYWI
jgi:hypothetical protein